jgi:hypothetical protein
MAMTEDEALWILVSRFTPRGTLAPPDEEFIEIPDEIFSNDVDQEDYGS